MHVSAEFVERLKRQTTALARMARDEDVGAGDLTAALMPAGESATFRLIARQDGVLAGRLVADEILRLFDASLMLQWGALEDGAALPAGQELARLRGPLLTLLSAERTLLNFLQRLCGVATQTRRYVDAVAATSAKIYDTRKTIPGWRMLDKYAVLCGGGCNHRMGLYDAVLIKDNHLTGVGSERIAARVFHMLNAVRMDDPVNSPAFIQVEADSLDQFEQLLDVVGIDIILCDNFTPAALRKAVDMRDRVGLQGKPEIEASGGITLRTVREVAESGVDRISVGAVTHSAPALDLSLERVE